MRTVVMPDDHDQMVKQLSEVCAKIVAEKRPVYTQGNPNTICNFQLIADMTGQTPGQVAAVYLGKQILSIMNMLTNKPIVDTEHETRFADARNYLDIAYVMWRTENLDQ